eukprot:1138027-Pelagomonas_calceolata.AAC.2
MYCSDHALVLHCTPLFKSTQPQGSLAICCIHTCMLQQLQPLRRVAGTAVALSTRREGVGGGWKRKGKGMQAAQEGWEVRGCRRQQAARLLAVGNAGTVVPGAAGATREWLICELAVGWRGWVQKEGVGACCLAGVAFPKAVASVVHQSWGPSGTGGYMGVGCAAG